MDILQAILSFLIALVIVFVFTAIASQEQARLLKSGHEKLGTVVYYSGLVSGILTSFVFIAAIYK